MHEANEARRAIEFEAHLREQKLRAERAEQERMRAFADRQAQHELEFRKVLDECDEAFLEGEQERANEFADGEVMRERDFHLRQAGLHRGFADRMSAGDADLARWMTALRLDYEDLRSGLSRHRVLRPTHRTGSL